MEYVARDRLTTSTRIQNAEQHAVATDDFPTRCLDKHVYFQKKNRTPREMLLSSRKDKNYDS
jgi:hypothetical protein